MERTIALSQKELHRCRVLQQAHDGAITLVEAAKLMQVSNRQALRLSLRFLRDGPAGWLTATRAVPAPVSPHTPPCS